MSFGFNWTTHSADLGRKRSKLKCKLWSKAPYLSRGVIRVRSYAAFCWSPGSPMPFRVYPSWRCSWNSIAWARERSRSKAKLSMEKELKSSAARGYSNTLARIKALAVALKEFYAQIGVEKPTAQIKKVNLGWRCPTFHASADSFDQRYGCDTAHSMLPGCPQVQCQQGSAYGAAEVQVPSARERAHATAAEVDNTVNCGANSIQQKRGAPATPRHAT